MPLPAPRFGPRPHASRAAQWLLATGFVTLSIGVHAGEHWRRGGDVVPVQVAQADAPVAWSGLSAARREALAPLHGEWSRLDAAQRMKWIEVADRFPSMSGDARERMQARMSDWARLSPEERGAARLRYREAQRVDPQERRARWQEYQSLSPDERKHWVDRSSHAPGSERPARNGAKVPSEPGELRSIDPATIRAPAGATTTLIDRPRRESPASAGRSKVITSPSLVDRDTLLPRSGPQAAPSRAERVPQRGRDDHK